MRMPLRQLSNRTEEIALNLRDSNIMMLLVYLGGMYRCALHTTILVYHSDILTPT